MKPAPPTIPRPPPSTNNELTVSQQQNQQVLSASPVEQQPSSKQGVSFRQQRQIAIASTPKSQLHDADLYEKVKRELPNSAAVDSIKFEHRQKNVNITDEGNNEDHDKNFSREPTLDEEIARIHRNAQEFETRSLREHNNNDADGNHRSSTKHEATVDVALRLQQLEECMARVDEHFSVADSVEREYMSVETSMFAKEKAELAERTRQRLEKAREMVRLADDSALRRERDNKFLDRETAVAELVFLETVQRQTCRKEEETRRLSVLRAALESKHYLLGLQDLRTVVQNAWVEGVSKTEEWKRWADGLSEEMKLPKVTK